MSYILEALKKSDAERKRTGAHPPNDPEQTAPHHEPDPKTPNISNPATSKTVKPWKIAGAAVAIALVGLGGFYIRTNANKVASSDHIKKSALVAQAQPTPPKPVNDKIENVKPVIRQAVVAKPVIKEPVAKPVVKPPVKPPVKPLAKPIKKPIPKAVVVAKKTPKKPALPRLKDASTYVDRAWNKMDQGLYGQAIKDLDQALLIEPAFSDAWFARGWANEKSGNEHAAIKDYDRTIEAKPNHAFALFSRGYLKLYANDPQGAVVDFVRTQGVATDDALRLYSRLWLYLSRERAGQDGKARLVEDTAHENLTPWPGPLIRFFEGDLSEQDVVKAIESTLDADLKEVRATGYFFLGISQQLTGNAQNARTYFEKTLATGAIQFRQYDAAGRELERLNRN